MQIALAGCGGSASTAAAPNPNTNDAQGSTQPTYAAIQSMSGWVWCSRRTSSGYPCAAGRGNAVSWIAQHQSKPSLSGNASQYYLGGATVYSNALWWKQLGANPNLTHFTYDFWVFLPDTQAPEALEFDVNQSFNNTRWVFGTECNFAGTGKWDVWDGTGKFGRWVPSNVACPRLPANHWVHFTWEFERSGNKVHYIALTRDGNRQPVDMWLAAQQNWKAYEISVAVQLDGNFRQQPYSIYVDKMSLTAW
jgi:hypothetical protein